MDRIDSATGSRNLRNDSGRKVNKKSGSFLGLLNTTEAPEKTGVNFSFYLSQAVDENATLEDLLDDVHSIGEKLIEKPFISNIKEYKEAIKRFIAYIVKNAYSTDFEKVLKRDKKTNELKPDLLEKIRIVDEKLEKFALEILQNQGKQLNILKKVEEIEGILVDLMR